VQSADGTIGGLEKLIDFANQVVQAGPGAPHIYVSVVFCVFRISRLFAGSLKCDNYHFTSDSYASMQKDGKGNVHMVGKILDHPFDINIGM
jgi:hypothetical protein